MNRDINIEISAISENTLMLKLCSDEAEQHSICQFIKQYTDAIREQFQAIILDCVPSYNSVLIYFNFFLIDGKLLAKELRALFRKTQCQLAATQVQPRIAQIPVYYGTDTGPDLANLAKEKGLTIDELIQCHTRPLYTVYALGFAPGFAYMGYVEARLSTPRHKNPRPRVAAGSVGIADKQTGIYPSDSPGGWNIIGKTPLPLTNKQAYTETPSATLCPYEVGDMVRFTAIDRDEYLAQGGLIE